MLNRFAHGAKQRGEGEWAFWAFIFACALTFCGTPDLHDALISHVYCKAPAEAKK